LDSEGGVLRIGADEIRFADLGPFHTIERHDEESREHGLLEVLGGPRLVTRHEVYTRVAGAAVVVGVFAAREPAVALTAQLNALVAGRRGS
jgi:hypothetical protein